MQTFNFEKKNKKKTTTTTNKQTNQIFGFTVFQTGSTMQTLTFDRVDSTTNINC